MWLAQHKTNINGPFCCPLSDDILGEERQNDMQWYKKDTLKAPFPTTESLCQHFINTVLATGATDKDSQVSVSVSVSVARHMCCEHNPTEGWYLFECVI